MIGKIVAIGPLAFKNRDTMQPWPEGTWAQVGDYVRVPKWGGDRWEIKVPGSNDHEDPVLFMTLNDHELIRDRKSTRLNSSHIPLSRMPSSA